MQNVKTEVEAQGQNNYGSRLTSRNHEAQNILQHQAQQAENKYSSPESRRSEFRKSQNIKTSQNTEHSVALLFTTKVNSYDKLYQTLLFLGNNCLQTKIQTRSKHMHLMSEQISCNM